MLKEASGQTESLRAYHLAELQVARNPKSPNHSLPPWLPLPPESKVLDIGCGAGQVLIAACDDRHSFGMDLNLDALKLGRQLTSKVSFTCGRAETLPFATESVDAVIARGVLMYTDIGRSLQSIHRVLRPGGLLWLSLHSLAVHWDRTKQAGWKNRIYCSYILLNGICFHLTAKDFGAFGKRESFQTRRGISKALKNAGFTDVAMSIEQSLFTVSAKRDE